MNDGGLFPGISLRLRPANLMAETAILGALLTNNGRAREQCLDLLPEHFFELDNSRVYAHVIDRIDRGVRTDAVSLNGQFDSQLLANLIGSMLSLEIGTYVAAVRDCSDRRQLIEIGEAMVTRAFDGPGAMLIASDVATRLDTIVLPAMDGNGSSLDEALTGAEHAMGAAMERKGPIGLSSGFRCIDDRLGGLEDETLNVIAARPGMGKEQPIDTPILTSDGWRSIGSLRVGDSVIGSDGYPTKVIGYFPQDVKQAYRVTFRDGTSTECGIEHLWNVTHNAKGARASVRSLRELMQHGLTCQKAGNRVGAKWKIPFVKMVKFPRADLPIDPYVLGVLIGDGAISGGDLRFSNPDMDSDIRGEVERRLSGTLSLTENRSGACPYFDLRGPGKPALRNVIASLGLNVKSEEKFVPDVYKFSACEQRAELLVGLMDTRGSCLANRTVFYTTSARLSSDVADLVRSLGGMVVVRQYDRSDEGKPTEYHLGIRIDFNPFFTARKAASWRPRPFSRYIWSVEPSRMVEQVCIRVANEDGLYVTNDYIVTHNSALACDIAIRAARLGTPVLVWSLEMSRLQLARRLLSAASQIPVIAIKRGSIGVEGASRVVGAGKTLRGLPIWIEDGSGVRASTISARTRSWRRKHPGHALVIVDHLHIVRSEEGDIRAGATYAVGQVSGALKRLSKTCRMPVIALAQLNRGVEGRDDKRPGLADLRNSGDIEQDADSVGFLYRHEYYLGGEPTPRPNEGDTAFAKRCAEWRNEKDASAGKAELLWAKVRDGAPGTDELMFDGATTSFSESV